MTIRTRDEVAQQNRGQFVRKDMPILGLDAEACALSVVIWRVLTKGDS
jgi:hypothetical protein